MSRNNNSRKLGSNSNTNSNSNNNANTKTNILKTRFNIMNKISDKFGFSMNNNNNSNNSFLKKNKVYIIIAVVLLVIILIVSGILIYRYLQSNRRVNTITKNIIPYIHDGFVEKTISYDSLPSSSEGNEYNLNMWLYINEYDNMKDGAKPIIYHGDASDLSYDDKPEEHSNSNPSIWFRKGMNTLRVIVGLDTEYSTKCTTAVAGSNTESVCASNKKDKADVCDVHHFPMQRWVNVNVSLTNNVIDIFMDGQLHKSCILNGAPTINKYPLHICKSASESGGSFGGFNGYISKLRYSNKALNMDSISQFYREGPVESGGGSFLDSLNFFK